MTGPPEIEFANLNDSIFRWIKVVLLIPVLKLISILLVNFFGFLIVCSAKEVNHASVMVFSTIVS